MALQVNRPHAAAAASIILVFHPWWLTLRTRWSGRLNPSLCAQQVDLAKASSSQDRLERQLDILQVHQKEICDALSVMESEAEHLARYAFCSLRWNVFVYLATLGPVVLGIFCALRVYVC